MAYFIPKQSEESIFGKEAAQFFDLERATIALGQGASEDQKDAAGPTPPKTDSSDCFDIRPLFHRSIEI